MCLFWEQMRYLRIASYSVSQPQALRIRSRFWLQTPVLDYLSQCPGKTVFRTLAANGQILPRSCVIVGSTIGVWRWNS